MNKEKLPYIILKYASTLDGIIGSNNDGRLVLSNDLDHRRVMEIRSEVDAILIGAGTLIKDNPKLTIRDEELVSKRAALGLNPQPKRVVLARGVVENLNLNLFQDQLTETILFSDTKDPRLPPHILQLTYTNTNSRLLNALVLLKEMGIGSVLIEGGGKIISEALRLGIANEIRILYSSVYATQGTKVPIPAEIELNVVDKRIENLGDQFALNLKLRPTSPSHAQSLPAHPPSA